MHLYSFSLRFVTLENLNQTFKSRCVLCIYPWSDVLCRVLYKKAVLSQRWPLDARYISRSWGVAEIWPFKTIQDGGDILNLFESKIAPLDPPSPKTPP